MAPVLNIVKWLALLYAVVVFLIIVFQPYLLFVADKRAYTQHDVGVTGYRDIAITTHDGLILHGWYIPARPDKKTILFFHGNASTWQTRAPDFKILADQGYGILLAGYRGYGGNPGTPSERAFYDDAETYLNYLTGPQKLPLSQIVLYGESLGTGVAVDLASHTIGLGGVILEAPYTSITDMAAYHYRFIPLVRYITRFKFDSLTKIQTVAAPKLVFLGDRDMIVPAFFGQRLFDAAPAPKDIKVFKGAGHTNMRQLGALEATAAFLK